MEKDYKKGIMEILGYISDNDSIFLRQIFVILLRHVGRKGGAA